nr:allantoate deiminase [Quercus suber]
MDGGCCWVDHLGNLHGRVEGMNASAEALLIGSHLDTVVDAGIFNGFVNGTMGKLRQPIEVIAFSDEEGVRFHSTFLGSAALAGVLPVTALQISDKSARCSEGNSLEITEENLLQLKYDPGSVWGYIEVHIEQGPVLEWLGFPLGVVKGIAGQTRLKVTVRGSQEHAGTVPMSMRQDPMAAAAELIVLLESVCQYDANAVVCDSELSSQLKSAAYSALRKMAGDIQDETPTLMSGAGHDAMAMSHLTTICPVLLHHRLLGGDISCHMIIICKNLNRLECCLSGVVEESDTDGYLERTFMSPASLRAGNLIHGWMEDAGLRTWVDQLGNLHGRVEGMNASAEALLIGSHLDTVVDDGIYDGSLGIVSALSALKVLNVNGMLGKLRWPIEASDCI